MSIIFSFFTIFLGEHFAVPENLNAQTCSGIVLQSLCWDGPEQVEMDWNTANSHCQSKGKRLPSQYELIAAYVTGNQEFRQPCCNYWTSTNWEIDFGGEGYRYQVFMREGYSSPQKKEIKMQVRCVSGPESPDLSASLPKLIAGGSTWMGGDVPKLGWNSAKNFCEKQGMRLPGRGELLTLTTSTNTQARNPQGNYWSRDQWTADTGSYWQVLISTGYTSPREKDKSFLVRCLKDASPSAQSDALPNLCAGGLCFENGIIANTNWETAKQYCEARKMRLPRKAELIYAYSTGKPELSTPCCNYWSEETWAVDDRQAWQVFMREGYTSPREKSTDFLARCVTGSPDNSISEKQPIRNGQLCFQNSGVPKTDWKSAVEYCELRKMRLPAKQELIDAATARVPGMVDEKNYWTSETWNADDRQAWQVFMKDGYTSPREKDKSFFTRCVMSCSDSAKPLPERKSKNKYPVKKFPKKIQ